MIGTQKDQVLRWLGRGPVCGTTLLAAHIPRYAARIAELRDEGYDIVTERCVNEHHAHVTRQVQYRLVTSDTLF